MDKLPYVGILNELRTVRKRLDSLESLVRDGADWTDEQLEWVTQRFDAVERQFETLEKRVDDGFRSVGGQLAELGRMLEAVIDGE